MGLWSEEWGCWALHRRRRDPGGTPTGGEGGCVRERREQSMGKEGLPAPCLMCAVTRPLLRSRENPSNCAVLQRFLSQSLKCVHVYARVCVVRACMCTRVVCMHMCYACACMYVARTRVCTCGICIVLWVCACIWCIHACSQVYCVVCMHACGVHACVRVWCVC